MEGELHGKQLLNSSNKCSSNTIYLEPVLTPFSLLTLKKMLGRYSTIPTGIWGFFKLIVTAWPLTQDVGGVEYSQTCLTPPHSIRACPKPGPCIFSGCVMSLF